MPDQSDMWIARTASDLRARRRSFSSVAFVPTMGALHAGHLALIAAGRKLADYVIVSIFVNPTQFAPGEDFDRYPRPVTEDLEKCGQAGVSGVYAPDVDQMYPPDVPACELNVPELASDLEGAFRPHFFPGVCRVVAKLLNMVQADVAVFGQKDYQQWRVVEAMAADLAIPTRIVAMPTVREADGLAMSSRNVYLSPDDRIRALALRKAMLEAKLMIEDAGETDPAAVEQAMRRTLEAHQVAPDYAVIRHPRRLTPLDSIAPELTGGVVALVAGRVGMVRLIDNMVVGGPSHD